MIVMPSFATNVPASERDSTYSMAFDAPVPPSTGLDVRRDEEHRANVFLRDLHGHVPLYDAAVGNDSVTSRPAADERVFLSAEDTRHLIVRDEQRGSGKCPDLAVLLQELYLRGDVVGDDPERECGVV